MFLYYGEAQLFHVFVKLSMQETILFVYQKYTKKGFRVCYRGPLALPRKHHEEVGLIRFPKKILTCSWTAAINYFQVFYWIFRVVAFS